MRTLVAQGIASPLIVSQGFENSVIARACVAARDYPRSTVGVRDYSCSSLMGKNEMGYNIHEFGSLIVLSTAEDVASGAHPFQDEFGGPIDPDVVSLTVRAPDGTETTYVYNTDDEVIRDDVGEFHAEIAANQSGIWFYRWWSTGDGQASEERQFMVRRAMAV